MLEPFYWVDRTVTHVIKLVLGKPKLTLRTRGTWILLLVFALVGFFMWTKINREDLSVGRIEYDSCFLYIFSPLIAVFWKKFHLWLDPDAIRHRTYVSLIPYLGWSCIALSLAIFVVVGGVLKYQPHAAVTACLLYACLFFWFRWDGANRKDKKERGSASEALRKLLQRYRESLRPLAPV